jgi:hypothetical protein
MSGGIDHKAWEPEVAAGRDGSVLVVWGEEQFPNVKTVALPVRLDGPRPR